MGITPISWLGLLDFIMKNQDQFTHPPDAFRDGLVLIAPPTRDERTEAANWMRVFHGTAANFGGAGDEKCFTFRGVVKRLQPGKRVTVKLRARST